MEEVCKAYLAIISEEAARKFPPEKRGAKGKFPFNVSKFCVEAKLSSNKGIDNRSRWMRLNVDPTNLKMVEALHMAQAVGKPFIQLWVAAEMRAENEQTSTVYDTDQTLKQSNSA